TGAEGLLWVSLRKVLAGGTYLSDALGQNFNRSRNTGAAGQGAGDPITRLGNRELQVLNLIGRGQSSREAADGLGLSVKTVETHRQSLKRKLNLATNAQLLQCAINWYGNRSTPPAAAS